MCDVLDSCQSNCLLVGSSNGCSRLGAVVGVRFTTDYRSFNDAGAMGVAWICVDVALPRYTRNSRPGTHRRATRRRQNAVSRLTCFAWSCADHLHSRVFYCFHGQVYLDPSLRMYTISALSSRSCVTVARHATTCTGRYFNLFSLLITSLVL